MKPTAAEALAAHFTSLTYDKVPAADIESSKKLLRDYLGVAIGGSQTSSGKIAARFAEETGGKAEATIIGSKSRVPAVHAAFANAIASHSIELDDVDVLALYHFSPPVISAALAAAERENATGEQLILAIVAGCEMMARASNAANFSLRNRGYHTTPTCGVFGAAVAVGLLIGLTEEQMVSALGMAGAQASGLMEMYGPSMQKRFNPGPAARNGVTAAIMAKLGYTGAATILDGERGFLRAFTDENDVAEFTKDLGTDFKLEMEFKAYSCARPIHNAIDCALDVRKQANGKIDDFKSMKMLRHPAWAHYHLNAKPKTYHEAQMSLPYSVAIALLEGGALPAQYQDDKLKNPQIQRLCEMLVIEPDESLPRGVSCLLKVETEGGASYSSQVDHPRGSIANPMTDEEMINKTHMLADPVVGRDATNVIVDYVRTIESQPSVAKLVAALSAAG